MKKLYFDITICGLVLGSLVGCGKEPDRPSSLAEQQSLMNGSHKPTKDQLAEAMSHVHFAGPKGGGAPAPGGQPPPSTQ